MAPEVQSDVLQDGIVPARAGNDLSHPINLPEYSIVSQSSVFRVPKLRTVSRYWRWEPSRAKREMQVEIEEENAFLNVPELIASGFLRGPFFGRRRKVDGRQQPLS